MANKITKIVECGDWDITYGFIIADEKYDIQEEIKHIKNSDEFLEQYGEYGWEIGDVFDMFDFDFEWQDFDWDYVAEI